jgi:hypothetical protein
MRRIVRSSLLVTEVTVFLLVVLLFLLNTSHPLLLLVPLVGVLGGCLGFPVLLKRFEPRRSELGQEQEQEAAGELGSQVREKDSSSKSRAQKALIIVPPTLLLSFLVAAVVISWLTIN